MFSFLKNHPFAVEAFFETSLVLTYTARKEELEPLIPECLELDTFGDQWAFVAVAMVQTKHLRPKGLPQIFGSNFFLIGYRVFVRFTDESGRSIRGLYILGSETDSRRMEFFGNMFTHYNYSTIDVTRRQQNGVSEIASQSSGFRVAYDDSDGDDVPLPNGSPFSNWKEARKFAGPLPFTFTYDAASRSVLIIEGVRQNWKPRPVKLLEHRFPFLEGLGLSDVRLANAFIISDIPYYWKKGRIERWSRP